MTSKKKDTLSHRALIFHAPHNCIVAVRVLHTVRRLTPASYQPHWLIVLFRGETNEVLGNILEVCNMVPDFFDSPASCRKPQILRSKQSAGSPTLTCAGAAELLLYPAQKEAGGLPRVRGYFPYYHEKSSLTNGATWISTSYFAGVSSPVLQTFREEPGGRIGYGRGLLH